MASQSVNLPSGVSGSVSPTTTGTLTAGGVVVTGSGFISVGTTPATAGNLRVPNATTIIAFRNAANSADVTALFTNSSNSVRLGPSTSNCYRMEADYASVIVGGSTSMEWSSGNATPRTPLRLAISANNAGDPTIQDCTGTPEGQIAAPVGSICLRRDGGATTTLYVKTSGAATNTGWTAK